jgi:hypothetical protein
LLAQARCIGAPRLRELALILGGNWISQTSAPRNPNLNPAHLLAHVTLKSCTKRSGLCRRARWPNITDSLMSD